MALAFFFAFYCYYYVYFFLQIVFSSPLLFRTLRLCFCFVRNLHFVPVKSSEYHIFFKNIHKELKITKIFRCALLFSLWSNFQMQHQMATFVFMRVFHPIYVTIFRIFPRTEIY